MCECFPPVVLKVPYSMSMKPVHAVLLGAAALLVACGSHPAPTKSKSNAIIGGIDAFSPKLNAIGMLQLQDPYSGALLPFCSATLINPTTVLSARHCAVDISQFSPTHGQKYVNMYHVYFGVGPDQNAPVETVEAVAADTSPVEVGGAAALGNDVSIYHLVRPVTDVTPIVPAKAQLAAADVGTAFAAVGYGTKTVNEDLGITPFHPIRESGTEHLNAIAGQDFQLMFPTYDAFTKDLIYLYGQSTVDQQSQQLQQMYTSSPLLTPYEIYVGNTPGDGQTCHGDSGGPLLRFNAATQAPEIYGTVSWGWFSRDLTCDHGTFYAAIGNPDIQSWIAQSSQYVDPCANLSTTGQCAGNVAQRCTDKGEGNRRAVAIDCSTLGTTCAVDPSSQRVGCGVPEAKDDGGFIGLDAGTPPVSDGGVTFVDGGTAVLQSAANIQSTIFKMEKGLTNPVIQGLDGLKNSR